VLDSQRQVFDCPVFFASSFVGVWGGCFDCVARIVHCRDGLSACLLGWWGLFLVVLFFSLWVCIYGEFDPGSGRTLAACLTHASRTMKLFRGWISGERVSNTWAICPALRDKPWKRGLIPDMTAWGILGGGKLLRCRMGPRPISLLVG
jgi:hypothetical protein